MSGPPLRIALVLSLTLFTTLGGRAAPPDGDKSPRLDAHGDPLPPGAVGRLGTLRLRHSLSYGSGAACVAFSPDGKALVSGGDVGLCAWDVPTGKDLGWFPEKAPATSACFSPDGKTLLTADNHGAIRHWRAGRGDPLRQFPPQVNRARESFFVMGSFFSANGAVAGLFGSSDGGGEVRLRDTETVKPILTRKVPGRTLAFGAALSPDGKTLAVSGPGHRADLIDVATGAEIRQVEGADPAAHLPPGPDRKWDEAVYWFAFSPDGRLLAGAGHLSFSVWEVATGKRHYTVRDSYGRLTFSPDGKHLACGTQGAIRLYEATGGTEVRRFERHHGSVTALTFSPDGRTLAAAGEFTIGLWDVATGKRLHPSPGHEGPVTSLAFSPDGKTLAAGDEDPLGGGTLIVWDLKGRKPRHSFGGHFPGVLSVAYSPDSATLATGDGYARGGTGGLDAQIRLWGVAEGRLLREFSGHLNSVQSLAFAPDGKTLASAGHDARARLWEVATGKRLLQIRGADSPFKSVAFAPDGRALLVAGTNAELALWRDDSGQKLLDLGADTEGPRAILSAAFLPDGKAVLSREVGPEERQPGKQPGIEVRFWDAQSGRLVRSFPLTGSVPFHGCHALSPDGQTLATAGDRPRDPTIELWDTLTGKRVGRLGGSAAGGVESLAFSPDGRTLASGGRDTTILLWDVTRARLAGLERLLGGGDEEAAQAAKQLAAQPADAVPFLRESLRLAAGREAPYARLFGALDDEDFGARERASQGLEAAGAAAEFALLLALEGRPSPEARKRLQQAAAKIATEREERVARLVADLEGEKAGPAMQALTALGPEAVPILRRMVEPPPRNPRAPVDRLVSPERRRLIFQALSRLQEPGADPPPQPRGVLRSLAVLEEIGTPEARQVLQELARGPAGSTLAREAGATLGRLDKRK
jgi:WD40 repeat protein